jgi:hypothetical protein
MSENDFEAGVREGRIKSLEFSVKSLTDDVNVLKKSVWLLYGAIGLVTFLPAIREMILNGH